MKQAIIDIGSNSIRLTLYETEGQSFKILFREKIMAGLAGYVEDGKLSAEGIECACAGLLTFRKILQTLQIENVCVFATASLRNISNTAMALSVIRAATGFSVEVISGEDEALFGYLIYSSVSTAILFSISVIAVYCVGFFVSETSVKNAPILSATFRNCLSRILCSADAEFDMVSISLSKRFALSSAKLSACH